MASLKFWPVSTLEKPITHNLNKSLKFNFSLQPIILLDAKMKIEFINSQRGSKLALDSNGYTYFKKYNHSGTGGILK